MFVSREESVTKKQIVKWGLRAPFLLGAALILVVVSPFLAIGWMFNNVIEPAWDWIWED